MAVLLKKSKSKAGRPKFKKLSSQGELLQSIWDKFGGTTACAQRLKIHPQVLVNWKLRKVPLEMVGFISRELGVPKAALNFIEVSDYENKKFDWITIIRECELSPHAAANLFKLNSPLSE